MIQSYDQLLTQASKISEKIHSKAFIQKIYSSSFYISIALRLAGETAYLCIGRGAGREGLWIDDLRLDANLRKIDKFLEYLRRHLSGSTFLELEVDKKDRIFCIKYAKWGRNNYFYFFYNARNLYFANIFYDVKVLRMQLFKSWHSKACEYIDGHFDIFDEVGRFNLEDKEIRNKEMISIKKLLKDEEKLALSKTIGGRGQKFFVRKEQNIKNDLEKVSRWPELEEIAKNENDFSAYKTKHDFKITKIKFKYNDHYKRRNEVFEKVKKLKKAQEILSLRYKDTCKNIQELSAKEVYENNLKVIHPVWYKPQKKITSDNHSEEKSYKVYRFESFDIAVGESARGNDQLRKTWASKEDIWFHLDGDRSAHAVIKIRQGVLEKNIMDIIGSIIIDSSKLNYTQIRLIYTSIKNLKGVTGVPGKVTFKKEKRISVDYDPSWRELLCSE